MISSIDWEFCNAYPRLYPLASTMGISKNEIDSLMKKIWDNWHFNLKYNVLESEIILRVIIAKLNHNGETLNDLYSYKGYTDEELINVFGIRQLEIIKHLLT